MSFKTVLFDLDGTVADTYIGITNGIRHAYEGLGLDIPEREELRSFIGPPLWAEFSRRGFSEESTKEAIRLYREYYSVTGLYECTLISGARELFDELKARGIRICTATCKPEEYTKKILSHLGVAEYFDFVGAATLDGSIGTKAEVINRVLSETGAAAADCLMVGDRLYDVIGAHETGMKCAGVLTGFGSREEFAECGADFVAEGLLDILGFI